MTTAVIMDVAALAILLAFLICGAKRGLLRSVAGLVIVVLALAGAGMLSSALTPPLEARVLPLIEKRVEDRMDAALTKQEGGAASFGAASSAPAVQPEAGGETPQTDSPSGGAVAMPEDNGETGGEGLPQIQTLLGLLGLDREPADSIADAAKEKVRDAGVSLTMAVVESVSETVLRTVLFFLAFAALVLAGRLALRALDLAAKLPGIHFLNRLGGAAIGAAEGALALFLAIWILRRFGVSFDTRAVEDTVLLSFFTTHTPLSALSF